MRKGGRLRYMQRSALRCMVECTDLAVLSASQVRTGGLSEQLGFQDTVTWPVKMDPIT